MLRNRQQMRNKHSFLIQLSMILVIVYRRRTQFSIITIYILKYRPPSNFYKVTLTLKMIATFCFALFVFFG